MKIENRSIDDIHLDALNEFAEDESAIEVLNRAYRDSRLAYVAALQNLRTTKARDISC